MALATSLSMERLKTRMISHRPRREHVALTHALGFPSLEYKIDGGISIALQKVLEYNRAYQIQKGAA